VGKGVRFGGGVTVSGHVTLEDGVEIGENTSITTDGDASIVIGARTFISGGCVIAAREYIVIGAESMVAELVSIRDHDHDPDHPPKSGRALVAPVSIGTRVWIGAKATITRGVTIGDDAVVGANALVARDVEERSIVGGVPARLIRRKTEQSSPVGE
jgi:acetyltransferase-like isoleucine patch superfamily enzyme